MSSPTPEQWSAMTKLVQSFYQKPDAEPFREPVDWQNMGLYDYPKIIKKPMDLGTIKKNIVDRKYESLSHAHEDVKMVWQNCMAYNADGSDFFILAQSLNKKWEDKFKKLLADQRVKEVPETPAPVGSTVVSSSSTKLTTDEKRAFAKSLYKISKEDLGKILVEIEKKCPSALLRNSAEDEIELNVDKLPQPLFGELQLYVKTSLASAGGGKPKKKSSSSGGGSSKRQKS